MFRGFRKYSSTQKFLKTQTECYLFVKWVKLLFQPSEFLANLWLSILSLVPLELGLHYILRIAGNPF